MFDETAMVPPAPPKSGRRVGTQVWLGVGALLAMTAVSILAAIALLLNLKNDATRINDRAVPFASAVATAALNAKGAANDERGFLMTGDRRFAKEAQRRIGEAREALGAASTAASGTPQRRAVAQARAGFEHWVRALDAEIVAFENGDHSTPIATSLGPDRATRKAYERALATAQLLGTEAVDSHSGTFAVAASRSVELLTGWLVVALVLGGCVALWLVRSIAKPLFSIIALLTASPETTS
ncbi:MAG: methyl-accepting chemotaxis protein [Thermoleophilaceae bacterium]|jgi:methyl-accepting chemotaxis protein|nr:methyl-accepting chemotaxis protein [Thermoleophilaceae bacterium]